MDPSPQNEKHCYLPEKPQDPFPILTPINHVFTIETKIVGNESSSRSIHIDQQKPPPVPSLPVPPQHIVDLSSNHLRKGSTHSVASSLAKGTTLLCFRMSDVVVSILVLLPLTIAMWRGLWEVMKIYTDPWVSILLGNGVLFILYFFQEQLKATVDLQKMNFVVFYCISRILLFAHAFGSINQWRGLWDVMDYEWGLGPQSAWWTFLVGMVGLMFIKSWCNALASPLVVGVDEASSVNDCQLAFRTPVTSKWTYLLDCFWSTVVIQNLVSSAWRGFWNLATCYLYPDDWFMSAVASLAIGVAMTIVLSMLQPCYFRFMIRLEGIMRLLIFDLVTTLGFVASVLAWRGNWDLYNLVKIFDSPVNNEWFLLGVGTLGSILFGCLSTMTSRGITIDGDDSGDGIAEWPISYVSLLQHKKHHGVPFPEPWVFRYLCTSQRMRMTEPLTLRRRSSLGPVSAHVTLNERQSSKIDEDAIPDKLMTNSIYVTHFDRPSGALGINTQFERDNIRNTKLAEYDNGNIC